MTEKKKAEAKTEATKPAAESMSNGVASGTIRVHAKRATPFWRCGIEFFPDGQIVYLADLKAGQLERLKAEPMLVVVEAS